MTELWPQKTTAEFEAEVQKLNDQTLFDSEVLELAVDLMGKDNPLLANTSCQNEIIMRAKLAIPEFSAIVDNKLKLNKVNARIAELLIEQSELAELRKERHSLNDGQRSLIMAAYNALKAKEEAEK